ncbi:MAG: hypothetical protein HFE86_07670 [Clostridiales bacterium]|nr:hypothetical protein [Clostridiales bacterium]
MSKANPFDREMSPRRRLFSNIFFALTTLLVALFVLWVLVSQPGRVRSQFDYTAGGFRDVRQTDKAEAPADEAMAADEELYRFRLELEKQPMAWNADFRQDYPAAAALLQPEDGVFEARNPYVSEGEHCITLALCSVDGRAKNLRRLDVLTVPCASSMEGDRQTIVLYAPRTFTALYDTETGLIQPEEVRADNFRLYYYTLSLALNREGGWKELDYQLVLKGVISDKEAEKGELFGRVAARPDLFDRGLLERQNDFSLLTAPGDAAGAETVTLTLRFNDFLYDAFTCIRLEGGGDGDAPGSFQVAFNEKG